MAGVWTLVQRQMLIYNDSYDTILSKWTNFSLTRNNLVADVISEAFKASAMDTQAPELSGADAKITIGDQRSVPTLLNLYIKDYQNGVIHIT